MIRSLFICTVFGVVNTLVWAVSGILLSLVTRSERALHCFIAAPWAKIILRGSGVKVNVQGLDALDKDKAFIFIPNHVSFFDIFALLACLPFHFKFIFKEEIMRVPLLGHAMRRAGYISIARSSPAKARSSIREAIDMPKKGISLVIFAEGTRSTDGRLQPLKRGAFQLALGSGAPIVPVAIRGSNTIMPKGSFRLKKGRIAIELGTPISTTGYTKGTMPDLMETVTGSLKELLGEDDGDQPRVASGAA